MLRIKEIINRLSPNKYIGKLDKDEIKKICNELDHARHEELIEILNELLNSSKYTKKVKEKIDKIILERNEVNEIVQVNEIIETIKEIEEEGLEKILDNECERYNKFTESNPAEYIRYDKTNKKYILEYEGKKTKKANLKDLSILLKEKIGDNIGEKLIMPKLYKTYQNKLISYEHNGIELFDINHILNILGHICKRKKYDLNKKHIKYYSIKDNQVGGFYLKEYIERENIKDIVINNRRIGMIKLLELINEPIIYKLPIEAEIMKNLYEIFINYEPKLNYRIEKYYIDLYLEKANIAIECDENGHKDRKINYEVERETIIKKSIGCNIYRLNPDKEDFSLNNVIRDLIELIKIEKKY
jgi:very-short-patch-repair endonuclease